MLRLVQKSYLLQKQPMFDDDYIEKMANFYTSEATKKLFPNIDKIPFYQWLCSQQNNESRYENIG